MTTTKITLAKPLADYLINRIYEDDLPVHAETGRSYRDPNGDFQVDICIETENKQLVFDTIQEGINQIYYQS